MRGTISAKVITGGGIDSLTGVPIPVTFTWGDPVDCLYKAVALSSNGRYAQEKFQIASYEITLEDMEFTGKTFRLTDNRGSVVCEKEVISIEILEEVQRVKILV